MSRVRKSLVLFLTHATVWISLPDRASAGPNVVAHGTYTEVPFKRAEGRDTHGGKEVVFSFDEPEFDFGRVVVRSSQPRSVVRRDLFVGFTGQGLFVDTRGSGGGGGVTIDELEIWLRIRGRLQSEASYEWEVEGGGSDEIEGGVPAVIPMFWADGKQFGAEVLIRDPYAVIDQTDPGHDDERLHRLNFPHGVVKLPSFERQTGEAWIVLKPRDYGQFFRLSRFSFREIDSDLASGVPSAMPVPVRYIPIRSELEDDIAAAAERGTQALKRFQNEDNFWQGNDPESSVQITADIVSALAEDNPKGEGLSQAMDWLAKQEPGKGQRWQLRTLTSRLYCLSRFGGYAKYRTAINTDAAAIIDSQLDEGGWSAVIRSNEPGRREASGPVNPDNDSSFLALLALREARFAGAELDNRVWRKMLQYWTDAQAFDGGFREKLERYGGVGQATTSAYSAMGAAALIASLDMAAGLDGKRCNAYLASKTQLRAATKALDWLNKNYKEQFKDVGSFAGGADPYHEGTMLHFLGVVSGLAHFHDKRHFEETARELMQHYDEGQGMFGVRNPQNPQAGWAVAPDPLRTAMALHVLSGGTAPTICQRIIAGDSEDKFAEFSSDVVHLVRHLSEARGRQFNWRRTTIDREVRELVEVPLLFLNVVGPINWTSAQWEKIRAYCLAGGTVVVNIHEGQEGQRAVVADALKAAFPEYAPAELPTEHPLFSIETKLDKRPKLQALSNGFRHFLFLPAESWSCRWHLYSGGEKDETFAFMNNLLTYATDSQPLRSSFAVSTYATGSVPSKAMTVQHLETGSALPAYPGLLESMNRLMQTNFRLSIKSAGESEKSDMLWVSVTGESDPSEAVKSRMLETVKSGRFLLVDVVSGNASWDEHYRAVLKSLAPGISLEKLRRVDPIYTGEVPGTQGFDVVDVAFRKALHTKLATRGRADLFTIRLNGKPVGLYSAHDLASGVGYHLFPNCRGPVPEDARKLVMNAFLEAYRWKVNPSVGS